MLIACIQWLHVDIPAVTQESIRTREAWEQFRLRRQSRAKGPAHPAALWHASPPQRSWGHPQPHNDTLNCAPVETKLEWPMARTKQIAARSAARPASPPQPNPAMHYSGDLDLYSVVIYIYVYLVHSTLTRWTTQQLGLQRAATTSSINEAYRDLSAQVSVLSFLLSVTCPLSPMHRLRKSLTPAL